MPSWAWYAWIRRYATSSASRRSSSIRASAAPISFVRHPQVVDRRPVEPLRQLAERGVAAGPYLGDDPGHRVAHVRPGVARPRQDGVERAGLAAKVETGERHGLVMLPGPLTSSPRPGAATGAAIGHHRTMPARPELSTLASTLDEVTRRVSALAEQSRDAGDEALAAELFGVERALTGALRRLSRLSNERH